MNQSRSFKYNNAQPSQLGYNEVLQGCFSVTYRDKLIFKFISKLKLIKASLKMWNKNKISIRQQYNLIRQHNNLLYYQTISNPPNEKLILEYMQNLFQLQIIIHAEAMENQQKAKVRWPTQGDRPTKFFQATMTARRNNLHTHILIDEKRQHSIDP